MPENLGDFWRLVNAEERKHVFAILAQSHLALDGMHKLIEDEILPRMGAGKDPFDDESLRRRFQNQVIQDYKSLRRRY